jgi:hypothetical protein
MLEATSYGIIRFYIESIDTIYRTPKDPRSGMPAFKFSILLRVVWGERSMSTWINEDGTEIEIRLAGSGSLMDKYEIKLWVGEAFGIFVLNADLLMIVDLSAISRGATRNSKAIRLLRGSSFEPLAEIYGCVLVATYNEISMRSLVREDM